MRLGSFKITVTELPLKWILELLRWTQATKYRFRNGLMALGSLQSEPREVKEQVVQDGALLKKAAKKRK